MVSTFAVFLLLSIEVFTAALKFSERVKTRNSFRPFPFSRISSLGAWNFVDFRENAIKQTRVFPYPCWRVYRSQKFSFRLFSVLVVVEIASLLLLPPTRPAVKLFPPQLPPTRKPKKMFFRVSRFVARSLHSITKTRHQMWWVQLHKHNKFTLRNRRFSLFLHDLMLYNLFIPP